MFHFNATVLNRELFFLLFVDVFSKFTCSPVHSLYGYKFSYLKNSYQTIKMHFFHCNYIFCQNGQLRQISLSENPVKFLKYKIINSYRQYLPCISLYFLPGTILPHVNLYKWCRICRIGLQNNNNASCS